MSHLTDTMESKIVNHIFGNYGMSISGTLYFALFTTMPADENSAGVEPTSIAGYSRVAVSNNQTNFGSNVTDGIKKNKIAITFPTASQSWGSIVGMGVFESATLGALPIIAFTFGSPTTIAANDIATFPIDSITLTIT